MTSGISNVTELPAFKKLEASLPSTHILPTQLIDIAYQHPDYFSPGKGWHYSNTNYFLAGLIIKKVTHQSLAKMYQQRFFSPLHMHHTFYSDHYYPTSVEQQMAHAYNYDQDITHFNAGLPGSAGSMVMDNQDLLAWINALFVSGNVLSQDSLKQLTTTITIPPTPPKPPNAHYGLGVYSMMIPHMGKVWWYTGVINGYTSIFVWIPLKNRIIVAQVASWPADNVAVLFPNQELVQEILRD
jgi:D-alanyl-D-alanine carboxypeptidase